MAQQPKIASSSGGDVDDGFYDAILAHLEKAPALYRPTAFWEAAMLKIGESLRNGGVTIFRRLDATRAFFVPSYHSEGLRFLGEDVRDVVSQHMLSKGDLSKKDKALLDTLDVGYYLAQGDYRAFLAGDRIDRIPYLQSVSESQLGEPVDQVCFQNRMYSRSMLNYLNGLVFLKQHVDTNSIQCILEIGGGFGVLGEILLGDTQNKYFYVNVDIPPASFAASWYLKELYGKMFISNQRFPQDSAFTMSMAGGQAAVLNSWQLPHLRGNFDLFVNFVSFQEMEPLVVENYVSHVSRLNCKYALLRNLREGKFKSVLDKDQPSSTVGSVTGDLYDEAFGKNGYCLVAKNVFPFGFQTVDQFHSELRLYRKL